MEIALRLENENDYRLVEELTREAFWNVYVPGADEHVLIHKLRKTKEFIKKEKMLTKRQDRFNELVNTYL